MASLARTCMNVNEIDSEYKSQHNASSCDCGYYPNEPKINNCFFNFESINYEILPGAVINSATLQLEQVSSDYSRSQSIQVILCGGDWAAFTWNSQPPQDIGNVFTSMSGSGGCTRSIDVTALVQWLVSNNRADHIFKLQRNPNSSSGSGDAKSFSTSAANHSLIIDYTPATPPTTPTYIRVSPTDALMGASLYVSWDGSQSMGSEAAYSYSQLQISQNGGAYTDAYIGSEFSAAVDMPNVPGGNIAFRVRICNNFGYCSDWATSGNIQCLGASTINSVSDFAADAATDSFNLNLKVYNTNFTHNISLVNASTLNVITDGSTPLSWNGLTLNDGNNTITLTPGQRSVLLNLMSSVKTLGVKVTAATYNSGTQVGSTQTSAAFSAMTSPANSAPTGASFTYADSNSAIAGVTGNNQWLVQNQSTLAVTVGTASAKNGASISSYSITIANKTVTNQSPGTFNLGTINQSGALVCTLTVTDSRGYTVSSSAPINVASYTGIQITAADSFCMRNGYNTTATLATLTVKGTLSQLMINGVNKNAFSTIQYRYKLSSGDESTYSTWKSETCSSTSTAYSLNDTALQGDKGATGFTGGSSFNVQVKVTDKISEAAATYTLPPAIPLLTFGNGKVGVNNPAPAAAIDVSGSGKVSGNFEVNGDGTTSGNINAVSYSINGSSLVTKILSTVYPVGSLYYNASDGTNPATLLGFGTWAAFGAGRVPVGYCYGDSNFGTIGGLPGTPTVTLDIDKIPAHAHTVNPHSHSHNLGTGNAGSHGHNLQWNNDRIVSLSGNNQGGYPQSVGYRTGYSAGSVYDWSFIASPAGEHSHGITGGISDAISTMQSAGGGQDHNNIQPSIVVYIWKRTA